MDYETRLDPQIAAAMAKAQGGAKLAEIDLDALRESHRSEYPEPDPDVDHLDELIHGPHTGDGVFVRVHRPKRQRTGRPCLLWIHGGGYVLHGFEKDQDRIDRWVQAHDCVVVSPEYRLAPEHPFPAALDDCFDAYGWVLDHADELGVDRSRVTVGGMSAGGGLAASLAARVRDTGTSPFAHQMLIYPMLDDRADPYPSRSTPCRRWSPDDNAFGWSAYLGEAAVAGALPDYAVPARMTDLVDLPSAFIGVGTCDIFRDESIGYALRLLAAGVEVELHVYPGAPHGFLRVAPDAGVSTQFESAITAFFRRALG